MRNQNDVRRAIDEIAKALAIADRLSTAVRRGLEHAAQHALDIEMEIERAFRSIKRLRTTKKGARR